MKKQYWIVLVVLLIIAAIGTIHLVMNKDKYDSGEHVIAGDGRDSIEKIIQHKGLTLRFPPADDPNVTTTKDHKFRLENGFDLSFGQILALGGDIFGTEEPISDGGANIKNRFLQHFDTMSSSDKYGNAVDQIPKVLKIFQKELDLIDNAVQKGESTKAAYHSLGNDLNVEYNVETGGGSRIGSYMSDVYPKLKIAQIMPEGRMMSLAGNNWDHFASGGMSWSAYFAGHTLAMETAAEAARTNNNDLLNKAYAYDAFACHFLSDHFAAGHLRTPRKELKYGTGSYKPWVQKLGDYLSKLMHDEENEKGLLVANNACYNDNSKVPCNTWMAYGDGSMLETKNKENLQMQLKALQQSVDEVWQSYKAKAPVTSTVFDYIPNIDFTKPIPGSDSIPDEKTIGGTFGVCSPSSCEKTLGPDWHEIGTTGEGCIVGEKKICQRREDNHTPMFYYDKELNTLFKRTPDNNFTKVISGLKSLYDFEPALKSGKAHALGGTRQDPDGIITIYPRHWG